MHQLASLTIPDSVMSIGNFSFYGSSLESVSIPASVIDIGSYAFSSCAMLQSATIEDSTDSSSGARAKVNLGQYAFYNCSSLASVTIGNSVTSIGKGAFGLHQLSVQQLSHVRDHRRRLSHEYWRSCFLSMH